MKYHKILGRGLLVMFAALSLWGCGNGNGDAPSFNGVTGEHPTNWLATHGVAFRTTPTSCFECHGIPSDRTGGISKVSCTFCHTFHQFPYPGSVHGPIADPTGPSFSKCLVCHNNSPDKIGDYPVPRGVPPNCRGCHTKASPENGCGACHGTDANGGRPNNSAPSATFPDIQGGHFAGDHLSFDCFNCHGNNSGDGFATHGPSDRIAHSDANVIIDFSPSGTTTHFTRFGNGHGTCTSDCHDNASEVRNW